MMLTHKKITLKISDFIFNRILDYVDCFKNNEGNLEIMSKEIEELIKIKSIIFLSKNYIPKPENLPYITSLFKKIDNSFVSFS